MLVPGQHDEAGDVAVGVLDILLDDVEPVEFRGERRGERGHGAVLDLGNHLGRARRVAGDHRLPAILADIFAALAKRMDVAVHGLDLCALDARQHHQLEMNRQEILADDVQARFRQQMMDVGDTARDRVLDRDHGEIGLAGLHRVEGVLEGRTGQRLHRREHVAAGGVGIGAGLALEGNPVGLFRHAPMSLLRVSV